MWMQSLLAKFMNISIKWNGPSSLWLLSHMWLSRMFGNMQNQNCGMFFSRNFIFVIVVYLISKYPLHSSPPVHPAHFTHSAPHPLSITLHPLNCSCRIFLYIPKMHWSKSNELMKINASNACVYQAGMCVSLWKMRVRCHRITVMHSNFQQDHTYAYAK